MAQRYRLNVDPDVEHELTDAEVADLKAFGFEVKPAGRSTTPAKSGDEKKES